MSRILIIFTLLILAIAQTADANEYRLLGVYEPNESGQKDIISNVIISGDGNTIIYDISSDKIFFSDNTLGTTFDSKNNIIAINKNGEKKWTYTVVKHNRYQSTVYRGLDTSFDGNYTVFAVSTEPYFSPELYVLDGKGRLRWIFKPNNAGNSSCSFFDKVTVSSDGRYIAAVLYGCSKGSQNDGIAYFLDNTGKLLWNWQIQNENILYISISPNGEYVSISTNYPSNPGEKEKSKLYLLDKEKRLKKIFDTTTYGSVLTQRNVLEGILIEGKFFDYDLNIKWQIDRWIDPSTSSISGDTVVGQSEAEGKLIFINNGVISEEYDLNDIIGSISISADGNYVVFRSHYMASSLDKIYLLGKERLPNIISPKEGEYWIIKS